MSTTVAAPKGSHWEYESVKTAKGTQDLGEVPILVWDSLDGMVEHYSEEGVLAMADGTSFRVSYQNIGRRSKSQGKSDDDIATAIVNFRPGKRQVGASTPASRARRAAQTATEKGIDGDRLAALIDRIVKGEKDLDSLGV